MPFAPQNRDIPATGAFRLRSPHSRPIVAVSALAVLVALILSPTVATALPTSTSGPVAGGTDVTVPVPGPDSFIDIATGNNHSLALDADGNIWSWGDDQNGQLGNGVPIADVTTPTQITTGTTYTSVAAGFSNSLALDADGNLWTWGDDSDGKLGNGDATSGDITTPTQITTGTTYTSIAVGYDHALATDSDGNLWAWGDDSFGKVGNGTTTGDVTSPTKISTGTTFTTASAGLFHSLAIDSDGNLWAWGNDGNGQLGNGATTGDVSSPTKISTGTGTGTGTTFATIAAGAYHSLALDTDGNFWAWGNDGAGQLGNGNTSSTTLTSVTQISTGITYTVIAAGANHSLGLDADGNLWTWGFNSSGQIGNGTITGNLSSPTVISTGATYIAVAGSIDFSLAIDVDGNLWTWGDDDSGQLGNGDSTSSDVTVPTQISSATEYTAVSAGYGHTLAIDTDGNLWAWGRDTDGRLGNGAPTDDVSSPSQITTGTNYTAIAAGQNHSLALDSSGNIWGWGQDTYEQVGNGASTDDVIIPTQVTTGTSYTAISAGQLNSLALDSDGNLWTWGNDVAAQLGNGAPTGNVDTPTQVTTGTTYTGISAGAAHSLAVDADGNIWAWGYDGSGRIGNGAPTADVTTPTQISSGTNFTAVSAGSVHSLALDSDGNVWAWGGDDFEQIGNGAPTADVTVPTQITTGTSYTAIAADVQHSLALDSAGNVWAWGGDGFGKIGNGAPTANITTPTQITTVTTYTAIATGANNSFAFDSAGNLWGWGDDDYGQVGNGATTGAVTVPTRISSQTVVTSVAFNGTPGTNLTRLSDTRARVTTPAGTPGAATITITYSYNGTSKPELTLGQTFTYIAATPSSGGSGGSNSGSGRSAGNSSDSTSSTDPTFTLQPVDTTATAGDLATFTIEVEGDPAPTVQWQQSTDNGTTWTDIDGETDWTLTFTATDSMNGALYRAIATNDTGDTTSDTATLTVLAAEGTTEPISAPTATPATPNTENASATVPVWVWAIIAAVIVMLITLGIIVFRRRV